MFVSKASFDLNMRAEFKLIAQANPIGLSLRQVFDDMDADSDGHLSRSEMRTAFEKLGHTLDDRQLNHIFKQVDIDASGKVSFDGECLYLHRLRTNVNMVPACRIRAYDDEKPTIVSASSTPNINC